MNKGISVLATNIDIDKLVSVWPNIDSDIWNEWSVRQDKWGVHKHTKSIPIKWLNECIYK